MARELINIIYEDFRNCRNFASKNQITSAGLSIMNNVAERFLPESDKEFKQFLNISKGSDGEVKSMYYVAEDQNYISKETTTDRRRRNDILMHKISNFMFYLKK